MKRLNHAEDNALTTIGFFLFKLGNRECVISYLEQGVIKYFKVNDVEEKRRCLLSRWTFKRLLLFILQQIQYI
jgi:hypothetical protein